MKLTSTRFRWTVLTLIACSWMSLGVLSDCDTDVADQILDGVGSATADVASTLIEALFDSIKPEEQTPVTTSSLDIGLPAGWLA